MVELLAEDKSCFKYALIVSCGVERKKVFVNINLYYVTTIKASISKIWNHVLELHVDIYAKIHFIYFLFLLILNLYNWLVITYSVICKSYLIVIVYAI